MGGTCTKLWGGGGEVVAHSSVQARHGLGPAGSPLRRLDVTFQISTNRARPVKKTPMVEIRLSSPQPGRSGYVATRLGIPISPSMCCTKNVILKPIKLSQKFILPSRSLSMRPVIFGNQ